jgi:hypothetical protein
MPASLVTAVCTPIAAGLVAVTVTPGNTPPCASLTSPLMLPVELAPPPCANADDAMAATATIAPSTCFQRFISWTSNLHSQSKSGARSVWDEGLGVYASRRLAVFVFGDASTG